MEGWFELGYPGLFLASFLAATVLPFSSELILSGMLASGYSLWACIGLASAGNWLGGISSYGLGYLGKWEWLERYFRVRRESVEGWSSRVGRFGPVIAFFTWLPFVGDALAVALGFLRVKPLVSILFMGIGKALRYVVWALLTQALL